MLHMHESYSILMGVFKFLQTLTNNPNSSGIMASHEFGSGEKAKHTHISNSNIILETLRVLLVSMTYILVAGWHVALHWFEMGNQVLV